MKKSTKINISKEVCYEGLVSLSELKNGLRIADIVSLDDMNVESFTGHCKVQIMRDGHIYITEIPKRVKNKPIIRQTHSAFSLGKDKRYYFVFSLSAEDLHLLPTFLIKEAKAVVKYIQDTHFLSYKA